jgi:hypothetical protein
MCVGDAISSWGNSFFTLMILWLISLLAIVVLSVELYMAN